MTTNKPVGVDLPPDLANRLNAYQQEKGLLSLPQTILDVLRTFFDLPLSPSYATTEEVATLRTQVHQLAHQVEILSRSLIALQSNVLPAGNAAIAQAATEAIGSTQFTSMPLTYEDVEDEPDEILYDFLEPGTKFGS